METVKVSPSCIFLSREAQIATGAKKLDIKHKFMDLVVI